MAIFNNQITFGLIEELGEDSVVVRVSGELIEMTLQDEAKEVVFRNVEEQIFLVPVNLDKKQIMLETNESFVKEMN